MITAGKKTKTPTGIHAMDPASAAERARQGMQFLAVGSDLRLMSLKPEKLLKALRPDEAKKDLARY